ARLSFRQGRRGPLEIVRSVLTSCHKDLPEWRKRRVSGGRVLLEMAMHHFDLWRYLLDEEVEEVSAQRRSGTWEDESATVTARFRSGGLGAAAFAECASQNNNMEVYGRAGSFTLAFFRFEGLELSCTSDIPGNVQARIRSVVQFTKGLPGAIPT